MLNTTSISNNNHHLSSVPYFLFGVAGHKHSCWCISILNSFLRSLSQPSASSDICAGYSVLQGPTTSMVRPHPSFWRFMHGVCVVYFLFLVWMLFQDIHDARSFMKVSLTDISMCKLMCAQDLGICIKLFAQ